ALRPQRPPPRDRRPVRKPTPRYVAAPWKNFQGIRAVAGDGRRSKPAPAREPFNRATIAGARSPGRPGLRQTHPPATGRPDATAGAGDALSRAYTFLFLYVSSSSPNAYV